MGSHLNLLSLLLLLLLQDRDDGWRWQRQRAAAQRQSKRRLQRCTTADNREASRLHLCATPALLHMGPDARAAARSRPLLEALDELARLCRRPAAVRSAGVHDGTLRLLSLERLRFRQRAVLADRKVRSPNVKGRGASPATPWYVPTIVAFG